MINLNWRQTLNLEINTNKKQNKIENYLNFQIKISTWGYIFIFRSKFNFKKVKHKVKFDPEVESWTKVKFLYNVRHRFNSVE